MAAFSDPQFQSSQNTVFHGLRDMKWNDFIRHFVNTFDNGLSRSDRSFHKQLSQWSNPWYRLYHDRAMVRPDLNKSGRDFIHFDNPTWEFAF